jgi:hypothetical protein
MDKDTKRFHKAIRIVWQTIAADIRAKYLPPHTVEQIREVIEYHLGTPDDQIESLSAYLGEEEIIEED